MTVFILGAGFSLAANRHRSPSNSQFAKPYPLAPELGRECFGASWDPRSDVEAAFDAAVRAGDRKPIEKLVKLIQAADYYLGWDEAKSPHSIYGQLIERFGGAQFVSFNYDSLLEQVLLKRDLWDPRDGFGVPVVIGDSPGIPAFEPSKVSVLHLHGSVLLYPEEFTMERNEPGDKMLWVTPLDTPRFVFDPDNLGHCFGPFCRVQPGPAYHTPDKRIIIPVPDKSAALRESYVKVVYSKARELLKVTERIVAVGYSFAPCDRSSYEPLLKVASEAGKPLWLVGPCAVVTSMSLKKMYPPLRIVPVALKFEEWAGSGFELPQLDAA